MPSSKVSNLSYYRPSWVPLGAILLVDFENHRAWWNGGPKAISQLSDTGTNGKTLEFSALGEAWQSAATISIDYEYDYTNYFASGGGGPFFQWQVSASHYLRILCWDTSSPQNRMVPRVYYSLNGTSGSFVRDNNNSKGIYRQRTTYALAAGAVIRGQQNNRLVGGAETLGSAWMQPGTLYFRSRSDNSDELTHATLHKVVVYPRALSDSEIAARGADGAGYPLHFLGDSFLSSGLITENVLSTQTKYIGFSTDGVGGSTLQQQADRFDLTPEFWQSTLVIVDGALELTGAQAVAAIAQMVGNLPHERWVYVQANPINPNGDSRRTDWNSYQAEIEAYCGADHYCATLDAMIAEDTENEAAGLWGPSMTSDLTHPTNPAGYAAFAGIIRAFLQSRGWLP